MKRSRFSDGQILAILKQGESGVPVADLCREHGISNATYYNWRSKFGGMDASLMSEMKAMAEGEPLSAIGPRTMASGGSRVRGTVAVRPRKPEERMHGDAERVAEGCAGKKVARPSQRREMAEAAVRKKSVSVALACRTFGISESCYRYERKLSDENAEIADWLVRLTSTYRTWGFGQCYLYLRNVKG